MAQPPHKSPRELSLLNLLPNLMTVGAICAGLTAIRFAIQGNFQLSVAMIVIAAVLDGLDGRLARILKSESQIGAELDSLADFLNFGVAPALTLYLWALQSARSAGWIAVLIFAVCCVLRLARFNVSNRADAAKGDPRFFVGVPSPAGGLLVFLPLYLAYLAPDLPRLPTWVISGWMVFVGLLMIGRLPTPSLKQVSFRVDSVRFAVVGFVAFVAALLTYPWATLAGASIAYLVILGWTWVRRATRGRAPAPAKPSAPDPKDG